MCNKVITKTINNFMDKLIESNISGLLGGGDVSIFLNKILEELVPALVDSQAETLSDFLDGYVSDFANQYLTTLTLGDLIDIITGGGSGGGL